MAVEINAVLGDGSASRADLAWWKKKSLGDVHESLLASYKVLDGEDETRREALSEHIRLYGRKRLRDGREVAGIPLDTSLERVDGRLRYNVVYSVVETAVSRLGRNRVRAAYVPQGGDWSTYKQTRRLNHYVAGIFDEADVYKWTRQAFRWGCITGLGGLAFAPREMRDGWSIGCELVRPHEILVDQIDGMTGLPCMLIRKHYVDRTVLFERFKDSKIWRNKKGALVRMLEASRSVELDEVGAPSTHDRVLVMSAWHLPSGPRSGDGRYVVATTEGLLIDEEWDEDWYPIVFFKWQEPLAGFHGNSVTEAITGCQVNINKLLWTLERAYGIFANPYIAAPRSARIQPHHMGNKLGKVIQFDGPTPPTVVAVKPVNDQFFAHLQQLKQDAFEISGVSQLAALNRKPPELESGEAFRQFSDINDARHADPALNYERFQLECAQVIVGLSARMAADGMAPRATATLHRSWGKFVERIDWKDVAMDRAQYRIQLYPTSTLPATPAGRTATVQEWMRSGLIDQPTAAYLLEIPDLNTEGAANPMIAQYDAVLADIEAMVDGINGADPEYRVPEPWQDLRLAERLVVSSYLRIRNMGAPADVLDRLLGYLEGLDQMKMASAAQQQLAALSPMPAGGNAASQIASLQQQGVPSAMG